MDELEPPADAPASLASRFSGFSARGRQGLHRYGAQVAIGIAALGLLLIGIGWNGASGTGAQVRGQTLVTAQIPYVLSGGFLGLGLVVLGSALLVTQVVRRTAERLEAHLHEVLDALPRSATGAGAAGPAGSDGLVVPSDLDGLVAAGASSYHRPGCRLLGGVREPDFLTHDEASVRGLRPCRVCQPADSLV